MHCTSYFESSTALSHLIRRSGPGHVCRSCRSAAVAAQVAVMSTAVGRSAAVAVVSPSLLCHSKRSEQSVEPVGRARPAVRSDSVGRSVSSIALFFISYAEPLLLWQPVTFAVVQVTQPFRQSVAQVFNLGWLHCLAIL